MQSIRLIAVLTLGLGLLGCGEIRQTSTIKTVGTRVGSEIVATRGDAVIKVVNSESMPNLFGAADIFGRTRASGTTSLIFVGGSRSVAKFIRRDVDIHSEKTTMNSSPVIIQNNSSTTFSGVVDNNTFSGTSSTYNAPIFLPPNTPSDKVTGIREIPINVSMENGKNTISIGGKTLTVLSSSANSLRYSVR